LTAFLLGAGFNADATREASPVHGSSPDCGYPLVGDVLKPCFGLDKLPSGKSVEDLFGEALQVRNYKPMEILIERLMEADYWIAHKLASSGASNSYRRFFDKFTNAQFLTFNYDSLPEIFLIRSGQWLPEDGYGLPVQTALARGAKQPQNVKSTSLVIHLHGSACVFPSESKIVGNPVGGIAQLVRRAEPLFAFDPDSITNCFQRYDRVLFPTGLIRIEERVIAPIPDKSEGLKEYFIRQSYLTAVPLVGRAGNLIAIGYSFNPLDGASYRPLLRALAQTRERTLFLVSPQAGELTKRILGEYPELNVRPVDTTFGGWAADSFALPIPRDRR
jgi:hypothetical protein